MSERTRQHAEQELNAARRLLDAGDVHGALKQLESARKAAVQADDLGGLRELRAAIEEGYRGADATDEPAYERLLYASAQNVRYLSRRRAAEAKVPWEDPHPELEQPGRPEMRAERGVTKRDVPWIALTGGIAVVVAAAVAAFFVYAIWFADKEHRISLRNDTPARVLVGVCTFDCSTFKDMRLLEPGASLVTRDFDPAWFVVKQPSGRLIGCVEAKPPERNGRASRTGTCPPVQNGL
jgi:hypothetical protein